MDSQRFPVLTRPGGLAGLCMRRGTGKDFLGFLNSFLQVIKKWLKTTLDVVQWLAHRTPGSNCPKGQEIYPADSITHPSNNQNQLKSSE